MHCNCVTGGLLVNWWPSQLCSNSAAPTSGYLSPWRALFSNGKLLTCRLWRKRSFQGEKLSGAGERMDRPGFSRMDMILETTNDTSLNHFKYRCNCGLCGQWHSLIKSSLQTDRNFNHDCRDDKKRKAFQRGGPQKPKVQPAYEKVFLKIFTLHLLFSIQELIEKFHTESKARWQNLTCLLSSSIKSWESNCTSDV